MELDRPRRNAEIDSEQLSTELMLYHSAAQAIYVLNDAAAFVWSLCDGAHTRDEIGELLQSGYEGATAPDVERDVAEVLDALASKGLLE